MRKKKISDVRYQMSDRKKQKSKVRCQMRVLNFKGFLVLTLISYLLSPICLYATVLDNMESTTNWSTGNDSGSEISIAAVSGYTDNAVKMRYDLTSGTWVQMGKDFHSMNMSGGDSISFWYKGTGDSNNIEVKLLDADGDIFVMALSGVTSATNWTQAIITFSGMTMWTDSDGQPFGSGSLDTANINKISIGVTKNTGGAGTLTIDKIQSYTSSTPTNKSVDQCGETGTVNALGKTVTTGTSGTATMSHSVASSNPSPYGGPYYKIVYNVPDGYALIHEELLDVNSSSMNVTGLSYITFYLKGESGGEKPIIELWDNTEPDALDSVNVWDTAYGGKTVTTEWQLYSIPLESFDAEGLDKAGLTSLKVVFKEGASTIYLDQLRFSSSATPDATVGPVSVVDDMEETPTVLGDWVTIADQDADFSLVSVSGYENNAIQFTYQFNSGTWMIMERGLGYNVISDKGFRFKYKGTGDTNHIEFKVTDVDNVVYYRKFYSATDTDGLWRTISFPYAELSLFDKGDDNDTSLDFKNIKTINFAIAKKDGGAGTFTVDDFQTISDADFQQINEPGSIVSAFAIQDNPFSPNNDGVKDYGIFNYTLTTFANIVLTIYDTAGNPVMKIDEGEKGIGSHTITWNGYDSHGRLLRNGLYFYNFKAKGSNNQEDSIKHIIAIIR